MNDSRTHEELCDSEFCPTFADVMAKAPLVFSIMSVPDYRLLYINRPIEEIPSLVQAGAPRDALCRQASEIVPRWEEKLLPFYEQARRTGELVFVRDYEWEWPGGISYWDLAIVPSRGEEIGGVLVATLAVEVTDRVRATESLAESRELLQSVLDSLSAHIAVIDGEGTIMAVNEAWTRFARENGDPTLEHTGVGVNYLDVCRRAAGPFSEGANDALEGLQAVLGGRLSEFEMEYPCPTATEQRWFYLRANPLAGGRPGAVTAHIDITRLKQVEEALRQSEERFLRIIETTPSGITFVDRNGIITFANVTAERILGLTRSEMQERTYNDPAWKITTVEGEPYAEENLPFVRIMATGAPVSDVEHAIERPDGTRAILSINAAPLFDASGTVTGMVAVLTDVTDRKRAEQSLRESEEKYRTLVEMMNEGLARADQDYVFTFVNDAFAGMLGYTPEEMVGRKLIDCIPEEAREQMREQMARRARGETARYELEWRSKDGNRVFTQVSPRALFGEDGSFIGSVAVLTDITERKLMEEALRASEANYREIFSAVNDAIFVHEVETGRILDANPRATEMYGFTRDELLEICVEDISSGEPPYTQEFALRWIRRAVEDGPQLFEWCGKNKSGELRWEEVNLRRAMIGGVERVLAIVRDITDRKQAQERILAEQRLRTEFYRRTILAATEGKLAIGEKADIEHITGPELASWHVDSAEAQSMVRHDAVGLAEREGMEGTRIRDFEVCIGEATTNAIKHAGGGIASLHRQQDGLLFVISDNGPGIEALSLPDVALTRGFSTAGTLGMGYKLMIADADRVYLATGPDGTTVAVEMKLTAPAGPMQEPFPGLSRGM